MNYHFFTVVWVLLLHHEAFCKPAGVLLPATEDADSKLVDDLPKNVVPIYTTNDVIGEASDSYNLGDPTAKLVLVSLEQELDMSATRGISEDLQPSAAWQNSPLLKTREYQKYSPTHVLRRTTKKGVRGVRRGANVVLNGAEAGISRTQHMNGSLKDYAMKGVESVPRVVAPVVSPLLEGVVGAGNSVVHGTLILAKGVVRSGKGLNEGVLGGIEKMLKKNSWRWGWS